MKRNRMFTAGRIVAAAAFAMVLGGCSSSAEQRAEMLEQENLELRARNRQLEASLNQTENQQTDIRDELRIALAEKERLEAELESAQRDAADTGFEGMAGVTSATLATGEVVVDVAGDVLFDSGKASLKSSAKRSLDQIANVLNSRYSGREIRIAGHTDTDPIRKSGWKTNERLSSERALAVEEYLATKGVDKDRMHVMAFGPSEPKSTKQQSRRVEIVVLNQPS